MWVVQAAATNTNLNHRSRYPTVPLGRRYTAVPSGPAYWISYFTVRGFGTVQPHPKCDVLGYVGLQSANRSTYLISVDKWVFGVAYSVKNKEIITSIRSSFHTENHCKSEWISYYGHTIKFAQPYSKPQGEQQSYRDLGISTFHLLVISSSYSRYTSRNLLWELQFVVWMLHYEWIVFMTRLIHWYMVETPDPLAQKRHMSII